MWILPSLIFKKKKEGKLLQVSLESINNHAVAVPEKQGTKYTPRRIDSFLAPSPYNSSHLNLYINYYLNERNLSSISGTENVIQPKAPTFYQVTYVLHTKHTMLPYAAIKYCFV